MTPNDLLVGLGNITPVYWYCDDKKKDKEKKEIKSSAPFERLEAKIDWAKEHNMGVFFCVNELGDKKNEKGNLRHEANVIRPTAVFADLDEGTYESQIARILESPIQPSAFVKSGHGYHVYWFLDGTTREDLPRWSKVQESVAAFFGSDPAVHDPARLLRLPGSWHSKDAEQKEVTLERCDTTLRYTLDEIEKEFPAVKSEGGMSDIEKLLSKGVNEGERNSSSTQVVGSLLAHYPIPQWESVVWPILENWNLTKCRPPLVTSELRSMFDSISKMELQKRKIAEKGVTTFGENDMIPTVSENNGTIHVQIPIEDGVVKFSFQDIEQSTNKEMEVLLTVQTLVPGSHPRPFTMRVNLYSSSGMEGLARMLGKSFGKDLKWDMMLNTAQGAVTEYLSSRDLSIDLSTIADEAYPMLFDPFLVKDGANLIFGDGGTGKTMFCLRMALSLATGKELLGYVPNEAVGTLFVDYEDCEQTASYRLSKICADPALGLNPKQAKTFIRYLNPQGAPLHTIVPALKKIIQEHHIGLILVDSVASACGAEPEKAEAASRYYNALKSLNISSLSIAHVVKTESKEQAKAFGSVFWHNLARNTWNISTDDENKEGISRILGLYHRKFNNGPKSRPIGMKITYGDRDIRFEESENEVKNKPKEKIVQTLRRYGPMTRKELQTVLVDMPSKTLANNLTLLESSCVIIGDGLRERRYAVKNTSGISDFASYTQRD